MRLLWVIMWLLWVIMGYSGLLWGFVAPTGVGELNTSPSIEQK